MPDNSRLIAIGDLHGCSAALDALLSAVDLQPHDTLVTLGDYVNRGPDSRGVLERLVALERRCRLIPLLGNHDRTFLDVIDGREPVESLISMRGQATLDSYGGRRDLGDVPASHVDFLRRCRMFFETPTHFFVHASYDPHLPLDRQSEAKLLWQSLRDEIPPPHDNGKRAIVGHTSQRTGEVLDLGHLVCLDTGCAYGGMLTARDINSGMQWQADRKGKLVQPAR